MPSKHSEKAIAGRALIEEALLGLLAENPDGLINNEIARELGLESDFAGRQQNYLTYSVLGGLLRAGRVCRETVGRRQPFKLAREA